MEPFSRYLFLNSTSQFEEAEIVVLGCPFEAGSSYPGASYGPNRLRESSWLIESYSPYQKKDLKELKICDLGNIRLPLGDVRIALDKIRKELIPLFSSGKKLVILGGDHTITLGIVRALSQKVKIIHVDAHKDFRKSWLGSEYNHATVIRRIKEEGWEVISFGIRSYSREEITGIAESSLSPGDDVYLTFDMDVFDPSVAPAVSAQEPGGWDFNDFLKWLKDLPNLNLLGFDIVEFNPFLEGSHITGVLGASVIREIILKFWR